MKKIWLLIAVAGLLSSCGLLKPATTTPDYTPPPTTVTPTEREGVNHLEGLITMRPLWVKIPSKDGTYFCFLATNVDAVFITKDSLAADDVIKYFPVDLDPELVAVLQGTQIDPLTVFTPEEFEGVNEKFKQLGVQLNNYKIALAMNNALTNWADYKKLLSNRNSLNKTDTSPQIPSTTKPQGRNQQSSTPRTSTVRGSNADSTNMPQKITTTPAPNAKKQVKHADQSNKGAYGN